MKIVISILVAVAVIVATLLILALFIKKEYFIKREVVIRKPAPVVFEYIKYIKNQDHYSKWTRVDPDMKKQFTGTDGTEGFVYAWDGNEKVGKGEQEIKKISEGARIDLELRFVKPFENVAHAFMITEVVSHDQTKVTWGMQGKTKYPMNVMNVFMNNLLGKDLETSLASLKNLLERD